MNKPQTFKKIDFKLEAHRKPEENTAVIYLYGDIVDEVPKNWWTGEPLEGNYITPEEVRNIVDEVEEDNLEIHINSYGGSVFASVAIFTHLSSLDKHITTYNDGICASGASLIFMAGDKTVMPSNTMLMIHRASSYAWGNCTDLRKLADTLAKLDTSTVLETYKKRFNGTDEELVALIDSETWIGAREALEYGLCDELVEISKEKPNKDVTEEEITNAKKIMYNFANLKL